MSAAQNIRLLNQSRKRSIALGDWTQDDQDIHDDAIRRLYADLVKGR
jgi:hypothetical protein